jgi:hypothetical protein
MSDNLNKLLCDFNMLKYDRQLVTEATSKGGNGTVRIKGVLQRANAKNQNGRIYPKEILEREAQKYMAFIQERRALGELDHPESTVVNLKNVCLNVIEMHWQGDDLCGTVEILTTPSGNIVKELMRNGISIGVSSRGVGSVTQMGDTLMVEDDFNLICFDIVSNPSTQGAFLTEGFNPAAARRTERLNGLFADFFTEISR